jgi:hypothetical protein
MDSGETNGNPRDPRPVRHTQIRVIRVPCAEPNPRDPRPVSQPQSA